MPSLNARAWDAITKIFFLALAIVFFLDGVRAVLIIPDSVPLDPNEGWNAYHAMAAMAGQALYPAPGKFMIDNYPPLSFYIVGVLGRLTGDMILAGRLVSLMSFFTCCGAITCLARIMGVARMQAVFAAILLGDVLLLYSDYVGMDDPQLLGHAIALMGAIALLRAPKNTWAIVSAALLLTCAGFIKHNLVALPLALAIWLFLCDRRSAMHFVLAGIGFALLGLFAFRLVYGVDLLSEIASARAYTLANVAAALGAWFSWSLLPLLVAAWLFWRHSSDSYVRLCGLYAVLAFLAGCIFSGGDGVDANAMFDADIALALCCALALKHAVQDTPRTFIAALCTLSLSAGLWQDYSLDVFSADFWLHPMRQETSLARSDIAFLKAQKGPALCEMLSLCYWAGKNAPVDVFNLGETFKTGAHSDAALIGAIENRAFAVIQFDLLAPFTLSPGVKKTLMARYKIRRNNDDGIFLTPRQKNTTR